MKRKLSKKKLKKMIDSDFTDLSTEEIKALIQKEVNKGPDWLMNSIGLISFQSALVIILKLYPKLRLWKRDCIIYMSVLLVIGANMF